VIIFLAGHGAAEQDVSSPDGDGLEKYILPSNADQRPLCLSHAHERDRANFSANQLGRVLVFIQRHLL